MNNNSQQNSENNKVTNFKNFLENIPPNQKVTISPFPYGEYDREKYYYTLPTIELFCDSISCDGFRFFEPESEKLYFPSNKFEYDFITYTCKNCQETSKIYAIGVKFQKEKNQALVFKFGEIPIFGPPTPSKLIELIGPDKDFFLTGRRCEIQGIGIGASVYYRRVVENQKNRIFDKIIQVAKKISLDEALVNDLENAKKETQFSKAVASIKHALPESLQINGHNPLTLLHSALSEGVHDKTDQECLDIAQNIRIVLSEFALKLYQALKDEAELKNAVSKLLKKK